MGFMVFTIAKEQTGVWDSAFGDTRFERTVLRDIASKF